VSTVSRVSIIGMGSVGAMYGHIISENIGSDKVTFLVDEERRERYAADPVRVNGVPEAFALETPDGTKKAELILIATKATGLEAALETIAPAVGPDTIIISALNGITSEKIVSARFGAQHVIPCVVQGMDAVSFGRSLTYTVPGMLFLGLFEDDQFSSDKLRGLAAAADFLKGAGIPVTVTGEIRRRMYSKWMLNVGLNQTAMVFSATYGSVMEKGSEAFAMMCSAMREAMLCANAEGVDLNEGDLAEYLELTASLTPDAMPSMAQDRIRGKKTEVEIFGGEALALGEKHGIPVPVNEYLVRRVREIEAAF